VPWEEVTKVSLREEFVKLASQPGSNRRQLCRRFKISPKTAYKWLRRYACEGSSGLQDRSRRPHRTPRRSSVELEQAVVRWRAQSRNCWGGRKIARLLQDELVGQVPAPSTVSNILRRRGLIEPQETARRRPWQRFEREAANQLWQMDFKGDFPIGQRRCYPLTVLDDHSRFALAVQACWDQRRLTVERALRQIFERYGLPAEMLMDNGSPWGKATELSALVVWLIRLGIRVTHGRARHPQTQGKDERFHRTLKLEVLRHCRFTSLSECQREFDRFRDCYNLVRPHQALDLQVPASRYQPSPSAYPQQLAPIEYPDDLIVRRVQSQGWFSFRGRHFKVSKALRGYPIGLRVADSLQCHWEVFFSHQRIAYLDLATPGRLTSALPRACQSLKNDEAAAS
jgi:transposase InsO family protein